MKEEYVRRGELLKRLRISKVCLKRLIDAGMPVIDLPTGSRLFKWSDIDAWLQQYNSQQTDKAKKVLEEILS
jgi:hypothetical protein